MIGTIRVLRQPLTEIKRRVMQRSGLRMNFVFRQRDHPHTVNQEGHAESCRDG